VVIHCQNTSSFALFQGGEAEEETRKKRSGGAPLSSTFIKVAKVSSSSFVLLLLLFSRQSASLSSKFVSISIVPEKERNKTQMKRRAMTSSRERTSPRFRFERQQREHVFRRAPDRQANRRSVFPQHGSASAPPPRGRGRRRRHA